jgi:S-adenosylmethionine synthetase
VVASGVADKCEIELAYAIGVAHPVSIMVETFGTGKLSDEAIISAINDVFDLRPSKIISELGLRRPIYKQTASYGHFGREDLELPWEELSKLEAFKKAIKA